jgi:hypothetical protein
MVSEAADIALFGAYLVLLVVGLYLLYRWYRHREGDEKAPEPGD